MEIDEITGAIIGAAIEVHRELGPGLLESTYEACLAHLLRKRGFTVLRQTKMPIHFDGIEIEEGYRIDLVVNDLVLVELKAVEKMLPIFKAQLLSYLKLSGKPIDLLINFCEETLTEGLTRLRNRDSKYWVSHPDS